MALNVPAPNPRTWPAAIPWLAVVVAVGVAVVWWWAPLRTPMSLRVPGTDRPAGEVAAAGEGGGNVFAAGMLSAGAGRPADLPGSWPRFRGPNLDGVATGGVSLARSWAGGRPKEMWSVTVGEGFAGPAVDRGRVYLMDYDRERQRDAVRCLSLADGAEIWRFSYPMAVKRNHGLTRTVPTVASGRVVAMGPKCHVVCLDADTGKFEWGVDPVKEFGTVVPPWYTGQCPLVDGDAVILAPAGPEVLLIALDLATGKERWRSPNTNGWKMTHASVVPMEVGGRRYYLYCASGGVVAVDAAEGAIAWETSKWKINIATVPSPVPLGDGRVFFTGGYSAGSALYRFALEGGRLTGEEVVRVKAGVFGATQHSPVWFGGHIYGIRADGRLVCLSPEGKVVWASGSDTQFGLGPMMVADGLILAMDDAATLTLADAVPDGYHPRASAKLMADGVEAWAPFALAGDRLLARDLTRMVCLQVGP